MIGSLVVEVSALGARVCSAPKAVDDTRSSQQNLLKSTVERLANGKLAVSGSNPDEVLNLIAQSGRARARVSGVSINAGRNSDYANIEQVTPEWPTVITPEYRIREVRITKPRLTPTTRLPITTPLERG